MTKRFEFRTGDLIPLQTWKAFPVLVLLLFTSRSAEACGTCAAASLWSLFPPLLYWAAIIVVWYMAIALLSSWLYWNLMPVPPIWLAPFIVLGLGFFLAPSGGPMPAFLLLVFILGSWIRFTLNRKYETPIRIKRWVHGTNLGAVLAMTVFALPEVISPTPREPLDVIREWPGTGSSRAALSRLESEGEPSYGKLRSIVRGAGIEYSAFEAGQAAERLRVADDPDTDVPLILAAYERLYDPEDKYLTGWSFESELRFQTGVDLPSGSSPEAWREAWEDSGATTTELPAL